MSTAERLRDVEEYLSLARKKLISVETDLENMKKEFRAADTRLTNAEAGRMIGVHEQTIIRMKKDGRLKSTKVAELLKFKQDRK